MTAGNAKTAAQDPSTIAYLGDLDSGATAVSLPLINAAGILQVSPASPYIGPDLRRSTPARTSPNASTRAASAPSAACSPATASRPQPRHS